MSQDLHPGRPEGQRLLDLPEVASVLERWRKTLPGSLELIFLQQCGKGTLENDYALRRAAPVLMGSQTGVGAPNAYYASTLRALCADRGMDGRDLAARIAGREAPDMFTTCTTVDSGMLERLPERLDAVLTPLLARAGTLVPPDGPRAAPACFEFGPEERFHDAVLLLRALYEANGLTPDGIDTFERWVVDDLVIGHRVSSLRTRVADRWCGASILVPLRGSALLRYPDLPLHAATRLDDLMLRLLP